MINLVVALACEAKPLIDYFRLIPRAAAHGPREYVNGDLRLMVTGVGKSRAAACCLQLRASGDDSNRAWLNVGVAGHGALAIGTGVQAHCVRDLETGRVWSIRPIESFPGVAKSVCTVMQPEIEYAGDNVFDMEASGLCESVAAFPGDAVVQFYKVISDNRVSGVAAVTPSVVSELIGAHTQTIAAAVAALAELSARGGAGSGDHRA